jgi:transcriptional regulator with XRE-family HTH domain
MIRRWREFRGLSQEALASAIGRERSYLSRIERGERPYDQEMLESLARALGCEPADLLVRDPTDPQGLWSVYDQLTPAQRRQLVEIARTFVRTPMAMVAEPDVPFVGAAPALQREKPNAKDGDQ